MSTILQIKVYSDSVFAKNVPLKLPDEMLRETYETLGPLTTRDYALRPGYHTIESDESEEQIEKFMEWAYKNGQAIKVIGIF